MDLPHSGIKPGCPVLQVDSLPTELSEQWKGANGRPLERRITGVLEKTPESPLDSKEIKPVNPKGNQPGLFIGSPDAEAEVSMLWPPNAKSRLIVKDSDAGKD